MYKFLYKIKKFIVYQIKKMRSTITKLDIYAVKPVSKLHFGKDEKYQSFIGGLCTIFTIIAFGVIFLIQAHPIYYRKYPKYTYKTEVESSDSRIYFNEIITKLIIEIGDPAGNYKIDPTKLSL